MPHDVHLLDLSGPVQVFQEAGTYGVHYKLKFIGDRPRINSSAGLGLAGITHYAKAKIGANDLLIVPGCSVAGINQFPRTILEWIAKRYQQGTVICSICTGAFLLAKAGILNDKECTTHWRYTERLQQRHPRARVLHNKLYVKSENVYTSAGIATGIDLALFLLEERHGKKLASQVAKELVVYIRREGREEQESIFLQHRNHTDEKIHAVQDWIARNLSKKISLEMLSDIASTSPRNLTRIFKKKTGLTVSQYQNTIRVEKAKSLLANSNYKLDHIAKLCGLNTSKHLRTLIQKSTNPEIQ
jgi:transcriptional regulator GlxA family with amidase domain